MTQPTDLNGLRDFAEWKEKCDIKVGLTSNWKAVKLTVLSFLLSRASHSAPCLTPAHWPRGSCPGRRWGCTPAWSAPTTTPGSWTPPATGSASSKSPPRLVNVIQTRSHSTINAWNSSSSPLKETFSLWTMKQSKFPHQSKMPPSSHSLCSIVSFLFSLLI